MQQDGSPAQGFFDLRFTMYNAPTNGTSLGAVTNPATSVSNGLFTVTIDLAAGVFDGNDRWLEIGVDNDANGTFETLSPRQPITSAPYAVKALSAGTADLTTGVADGAVDADQMAAGAAAANLAADGQAGVASGGIVLSLTEENTGLVNAGYVKIGSTVLNDQWKQLADSAPHGGQPDHTAVWTGSEAIFWGGIEDGSTYVNDGARYDPVANGWAAVTTIDAPTARRQHAAVWTGSEMIVWGGNGASELNDGGRYNPLTDTWTAVTTSGAPGERYKHTALWTGSEMIVWGGTDIGYFNDGGRYDPATDSWTAVTTTGAPGARSLHTAVWTGSEMIIWGGEGVDFSTASNDAWSYTPGKLVFLYQKL